MANVIQVETDRLLLRELHAGDVEAWAGQLGGPTLRDGAYREIDPGAA
jgi:hypothetical protein